jgi:hypothetical protein
MPSGHNQMLHFYSRQVENGLNGSRSEEQAEARATAIAQRMFAGDSTEVCLAL